MKDKFNIIIGVLIIFCIIVLFLLFFDNQEEQIVNPPTLSLNPQVIVMKVGETKTITPIVNNLSNYTIEWQSDNIRPRLCIPYNSSKAWHNLKRRIQYKE